MRIALDARYGLLANRRGIGVSIHALLEQWRDMEPRGLEFLAFVDGRFDPALAREFADSVVRIEPLLTHPFALWEQWAFPTAAARSRADLIHAMANVGPWSAPVPLVVSIYDVIEWHRGRDFPSHLSWRHRLSRAYRMRAMVKNARDASAVLTISEHAAQDIRETLRVAPDKLHVIPLGFSTRPGGDDATALEEMGLGPRSYAMAFGALDPRKNSDMLLRLWASRSMPWDLVMVGLEPRALATLQSRYGTHRRIHLRGFESDARVQSLLRHAAVFLYPSFYEGFGLPILEAMAVGVPVILSSGTAGEEVARNQAIAVPAADGAAWEHAVRQLAGHPALWEARSQAGPRVAAQYSWRHAAERTLDVYRNLGGRTA